MNNANNDIVDVVIAGLGPTGATLAHLLGKRGLSVLVLEREPNFYGNARAVYTDDECMRIFQSAGIAEQLAEDMQVETPAQFTFPDGRVIGQFYRLDRPMGWPILNFLYQPWMETKLSELLAQYPNVQILRGRELVGFEQNEHRVTVTHQATRSFRFVDSSDARTESTADPDPQTIQARYLVGADGGRSLVRESLGIGMDGKNFPEPWLVVDLEMKEGEDALRHIPYFNFVCDPDCPTVCCPQPGRFHRFEFMMMPGQTKEQMEDPAMVRKLISRFVDPDKFEVKRKLVYTFNALVAREWRRGRVLLAGDAAHMTPQFMGQGMSSGVRDAANLAWKLDAVLKGRAGDRLLETYGTERYHHAKAMIDASVKMKDFVSMSHPVLTRVRNLAFKIMYSLPLLSERARQGKAKPAPKFRSGTYLGLPRKGKRGVEGMLMPQPQVRTFEGKRKLLDDVIGDGYTLIGLQNNPLDHLSSDSRRFLAEMDTCFATLYPFAGRPQGLNVSRSRPAGVIEIEEAGTELIDWIKRAGVGRNPVLLVRPDKYIFALVDASEINSAVAELQRQIAWKPDLAAQAEPMVQTRKIA